MTQQMTQDLVLIILGSKIDEYDGLALKATSNNSHLYSIIKIAANLKKEGFDLGFFDKSSAEEAAYHLMKNGHIIFFNVYNQLAFLKLPQTLTLKQYETLKALEQELKTFHLFEQYINPLNHEEINSREYIKNYQVNKMNYIIK